MFFYHIIQRSKVEVITYLCSIAHTAIFHQNLDRIILGVVSSVIHRCVNHKITRFYLSEDDEITLSLGGKPMFDVIDFRPYVDSSYFTNWIPDLYYTSGSEEEFIQTVWGIVSQLTIYSSEITETPRYPLETLLAGGGDCEDTAILVASMLKAAPVDWEISLVYLDSHNPTAPVEPNHVVVFVKTASNQYYIETTSDTRMNPYPDGIHGWYFELTDD